LDNKNFILINLNHTISRAQQSAIQQDRNKWIVFSLFSITFVFILIWTIKINHDFNSLIGARQDTIDNIIKKTEELKKDAKINLSKSDIISSYDLGRHFIPWSKKMVQLSEMTPYDMSITKLIYSNNSFTISAISKIEGGDKKEQIILNDFMNLIRNNKDFLKEFDGIEVKKTKKIDSQNSTYLSFDIIGKLKRKIANRLDDITLQELKDQNSRIKLSEDEE